jgi:hypothetical protein
MVKPIPEAEKAANKFFTRPQEKGASKIHRKGSCPCVFFYKEKRPSFLRGVCLVLKD